MSKKIVVVGVSVIILCITGVLLLFFCNRGGDNVEEKLIASLTEELKEPLVMFEGEETPAFLAYIDEESCCEIISYQINDDIITANVKVTSPDLYNAVLNISSLNNVDENEMDELLIKELKDLEPVENEVELSFEVTDDEYNPILTDEFLNVYYGGVLDLRDKMISEYSGVN